MMSLVLGLALTPATATAYSQDVINSDRGYTPVRWADGAVIRYAFQESFAPNNNRELVRAAFRQAVDTWMAVMPLQDGKPVVSFEEVGTTVVNKIQCDHINMISFTDTADPISASVVGTVSRRFTPAGFTHFVCDSTGEDIFTPVGQIVEADMVFNPASRFSTDVQAANTYDIQALALHLVGHWLGIGHTGIVGAAMAPSCDFGLACFRRLHSDDVAALWAIYGPPGPAISGVVTNTSGTPVKSAHVVATQAVTGLTTASAITDEKGGYRIAGLQPGTYRVFVEPLDGPVQMSSLSSFFQNGNNNFATTFLSNPVTVSTAEVGNVNVQVSVPAAANLQFVGVGSGGAGTLPASIRRGIDTSVNLGGVSLSGSVSFSSPKITQRNPLRTSGNFQIADVRVAADAPLGPTDVYFGSSSFTGGLIVTVNPQVSAAGIVDGAAFNRNTTPPHFAPGSMISIFGQDLAEATSTADRTPLPTQLAGVSVQVGDRWAPLYYVSPTQINAMIPFETSGATAAVTVVTGRQTASAAVTLTLGASAPRVFANAQGQGAILNGSRNYVQVDEGNPAKAGDVVVIFCIGLGKVQGDLASGLPSNGEAALAQVQATIAGRAAQVIFSGLAPGFVGLYQVNAFVPSGVPPGRAEVVLSTAAGVSNKTLISVQ